MKITEAGNVIRAHLQPLQKHAEKVKLPFATLSDELGLQDKAGKQNTYFNLYREEPVWISLRVPGLLGSQETYIQVDPRTLLDLHPGVDTDHDRYEKILRGKARKELLKFKNPREMIGIKGKDLVSIPVPDIDIPNYRPGGPPGKGMGGVGQGEGDIGIPIAKGKPGQGAGSGAGSEPGEHIKETWVRLSKFDIAKALMEELGLPNLEPKGNENIKERKIKWNTYSKVGNEVNLSESLVNILLRNLALKGKNFNSSEIVVRDDDLVFDSWRITEKPEASAVIIYMMDVSGSMSDEQKERVRTMSWYLSTIIRYQFGKARADIRNEKFTSQDYGKGVEEVYIIHDAQAKEVDEETFYNTRESGGTRISSAYKLADEIIQERYNPKTWNIYLFHFSDGDNWLDDNVVAFELVDKLMKDANHFGYVQTDSQHGSGQFLADFKEAYGDDHIRVRLARIQNGSSDEYRNAVVKMLEERDQEQKGNEKS